MARHPTEPVQSNFGMDWFRQIAEHNVRQGRASVEELLGFTRKMVDDRGNQASATCEHSMALSEETISSAFDCGAKLVRMREPQELPQVQIDLVSRWAQPVAAHTREVNQKLMKAAEELASSAAESTRR